MAKTRRVAFFNVKTYCDKIWSPENGSLLGTYTVASPQECSDQCGPSNCFSWNYYSSNGLCQQYDYSQNKIMVSSPGNACGATDDDADYV